ncbi:MAG: hypothetical protein HKN04_11460 [Rhodothermaceae bacterium]|nr:hypothetical protein [Rhodothermaceae bacterium]
MPQTLLALFALVLLSTVALGQQRHAATLDRGAEEREFELAGTDLARAWLAAVTERAFDEADIGRAGLRFTTDSLTVTADFGPDLGETSPATYDDVDDFDGFALADSVAWDAGFLPFDVSIAVRYVSATSPDVVAGSPTLAKEIAVTIQERSPNLQERRPVSGTLRAIVSPTAQRGF